jgi:polysaccharide biosynthesis transport protein
MDAIRPMSESAGTPTLTPGTQASPDLLKILLRWKWLPILGSAIGATLGYLYFIQQVPQYKASAQVQVVTPGKEINISTFNNGVMDGSVAKSDELIVLQSPLVLRNAVELGNLAQHRKLSGLSAEQIVQKLRNPKLLDVRSGTKDVNSNIINISVTTEDADLSIEIVRAIVIGYEDHVTQKFKGFSNEAVAALTKFSEQYEEKYRSAKEKLASLKNNKSDLMWVDGKPRDPASDKMLSFNESILTIENKMKNIDAILQEIERGTERKVQVENLLRMIALSTTDVGFKLDEEAAKQINQKDFGRAMVAQVDAFEDEKVVPVRAQLANMQEQQLGESHPSVISVRQILSKLEDDLLRRKNRLKKAEEEFATEFGASKKELSTPENRLAIAVGGLQTTLAKLTIEKGRYVQESLDLKSKMQDNQALIGEYSLNLSELEAVSVVAEQISENLRKLNLGSEYGQKTVTRLDLPTGGAFVGPFWHRFLGIGALLGFVAFSGLAYLLELADRSYRNPDEIAVDLGMPIIGHLPLATLSRADRIDEKVDSSIVTLHKNRSSLSEAFRGIRTAVFFGCQQGNIKVIQVTSPVPGDGKSTVAANMAVSIAQSGRRVCLIDCDFRRPRVAKIFGLKEDVGLVQVIGGKVELEDAIQETSIENLFSVTCGRRPGNPSELLSSERFSDALASLREQFDFVIVDTPPILVVSDPANVASMVDAVILTVRLRRNLKPIATRAAQMLHSINANMLGVVVNGIGVGGNGYGYGGYRYDNYSGGSSGGYGKSGYGGYGYGSTYQYGGYYGGTMIGRDYYDDQVPKPVSKKNKVSP